MIILALVVVGAASFFRLGVDRFPAVDLPNVMVRTTLPGASVEEVESADLRRPRRGGQPRRRHQRAALGVGAGPVDVERHVQPRSRHRHRGAGRARSRRRRCFAACPTTSSRRSSSSRTATARRSLSIALSGNLSLRELTEIADKIVKVPLERSPGVGEVQIVGGLERAINIWVDADRLAAYQLPITEVRDGAAAAERRPARRQRHRRRQRADAAHDGPLHRRGAVQRPGDRDAQRRADPRPRHRPRRRRHQGSSARSRG